MLSIIEENTVKVIHSLDKTQTEILKPRWLYINDIFKELLMLHYSFFTIDRTQVRLNLRYDS